MQIPPQLAWQSDSLAVTGSTAIYSNFLFSLIFQPNMYLSYYYYFDYYYYALFIIIDLPS